MAEDFQLLLVRKTLDDLGQFQAAKLVAKNAPLLPPPSAPWLLLSALQENLAQGNYAALLSLLLNSPEEFAFHTALSNAVEELPPVFRRVGAYLAARTQFLEMVVNQCFAPETTPEPQLVPFLQNVVAAAYDENGFRGLPPALARRLSRESEGAVLLPLAMNPPTPDTLSSRVFRPAVLLLADDEPKAPLSGAQRYLHILRSLLASQFLLLISHYAKDQLDHRRDIPDHCLADLIRDALLYRASKNIFYLPPRTSPLDANSWHPLLTSSARDLAAKSNLPVALLHTLSDHTDEVWFTRFSPLGRYLATGSLDGKCFIYDVTAGFQLVATLDAAAEDEAAAFAPGSQKPDLDKKKGIIYLCWEPHERFIVTCCLDTVVRIWRIENLHVPIRMTRSMDDSRPVSLLSCFTLGERMRTWPCEFLRYDKNLPPHFVVGSPDKVLKVFGIDGREVLDFYTDADEWLEILENETSPTGFGTTSAPDTSDTKSEQIRKSEQIPAASASQFNRINDFAITPNGKVLITANNDKQVHFYKIPNMFNPAATTSKIALLTLNGRLTSCSVSANGQYMLLSVAPEELQVWDISPLDNFERPFLKQKFLGQSQAIYMVRSCFGYMKTYNQEEELVLSGSDDGCIYVWKLETGQLITRVKGHHGLCNAVDWNRFYVPPTPAHTDYGAYWSSVGDDKLVKIWGPLT